MLDILETLVIWLYLASLLVIFLFGVQESGNLQMAAIPTLFVTVSLLPLPSETTKIPQIEVPAQTNVAPKELLGSVALGICGGELGLHRFSGKRQKFDPVLHARLMKTFPDWKGRMDYQKKQEKFYKLAIKKQTELKKLRIKNTS